MARLSGAQVLQLQLTPKNKAAILRCHKQHEELRYHVQPVKESQQVSPYHKEFMRWVSMLLPADKYQQFERFVRLPVPTTDITEQVFTQLERALQADNQYIKVEMAAPEHGVEFEAYRVALGDNAFWQNEAWQAIQTAINTVVLVDLPREQHGPRPAPYYRLLTVNPANVHDLDFKADGVADYIIFNLTRHQRAVFDDEFFRIVEKPEILGWESAKIVLEVPHSEFAEDGTVVAGLGYTPAARLWDNLLASEDNSIQAKSPISKLIGKLDEWLFDYFSLRYYKSYGKWPILWEYMNTNPQHAHPEVAGLRCDKGVFAVPQDDLFNASENKWIPQKARVVICEECKKGRYTGPGTIKRVTPPQSPTSPDLREPAGWIEPNVEIIKQAEEQLRLDQLAIIQAAVGRDAETSGQPRNEADVKDGVEVAQSMLLNVKKNYEAVWRWTLETMAILQYGRANHRRTIVDLGNEFFLKTEAQVTKSYTDGKASGLPDYILAPIRELISETRYRNNDEQRMRQRILSNLQPYPDRTDAELQAWLNAPQGGQTLNLMLIRIRQNFMSYILQFEREQEASIVDIASGISFGKKIQAIKERLIAYVAEEFAGENLLAPPPAAPVQQVPPNPVPET